MRRLLALTCLVLFAACSEQAPTALDVTPQFLIGQSPLAPITLDKSGTLPVLVVPLTVNRGIASVAVEDKFKIRVSGEFQLPDGSTVGTVDPKDDGVSGQKDTGVRSGSDVGFIMDMDIPAPTWDAIKDLDRVNVVLLAELVMTTGSGSEKVLDSVQLAGAVDPKDNG